MVTSTALVKQWPVVVHGAALCHLLGAQHTALAIIIEATHSARWETFVTLKKQPKMMGQAVGEVPKVGAEGPWFRRRRCSFCGVVGKNAEGKKSSIIG